MWYHKHISRDISFTGTSSEQYAQYQEAIKQYLTVFEPNIPDDLTASVSAFSQMNTLQFAALHGYEYFIRDLDLSNPKLPEDMMDKQSEFYPMTPIHCAVAKGNEHTLTALLDKKANPLILNSQNQMPIYTVLQVPTNHDKVLLDKKSRIFKMLLTNETDALLHQDINNMSIFHLMASKPYFTALLKEALIQCPQGISLVNKNSEYPIHRAIATNQLENAQILFDFNDGVTQEIIDGKPVLVNEQKNAKQQLPIHFAALYGTKDMMMLCINQDKAQINAVDNEKKTPLILAAESENMDVIDTLLEAGADENQQDLNGNTYLDYIQNEKQPFLGN